MNNFDYKKYLAEGRLLKEATDAPKAIILAGAPGAGKGFILRGLDLGGLKVMNIDDIFVGMLKKANVSLDLKNASKEERSIQAKSMAQANKDFKGDIADIILGKESFILDGTAASFNNTVKLKDELEEAGYEVFMLYVYTDLERSLKQNQDRFEKSDGEDRSLAPAIVLRTWMGVSKNYEAYKNLFGDNFVLVANTLEDKMDDLEAIIDKYLTPFKPTGTKEKTPAQQARSNKQYAEMKADVQKLLGNEFVENIMSNSVSKEEAQAKIKSFING